MSRMRDDWGYYAFIAGYGVIVALICLSVGELDKFVPLVYLIRWIEGLLFCLSVGVGFLALRSLPKSSPIDAFKADLRRFTGTDYRAGLALFVGLAVFHGIFTSMKSVLPDITSFSWDTRLADLDAAIHGKDAWLWLTFLDPLTYFFQRIYGKSWFILLALSSFLICVWPRLRHIRARFIWTLMLSWTFLGNLLAGLFLSGGPVFYQNLVGSNRFRALTAHLETLPADSPGNKARRWLWKNYEHDFSGFGTGISAFPSIHLAFATLLALVAFRLDRRLGYLAVAYLAVILVGSVHLGWHYAIDGYASIIVTALIWKAVGWASQARVQPTMVWSTS